MFLTYIQNIKMGLYDAYSVVNERVHHTSMQSMFSPNPKFTQDFNWKYYEGYNYNTSNLLYWFQMFLQKYSQFRVKNYESFTLKHCSTWIPSFYKLISIFFVPEELSYNKENTLSIPRKLQDKFVWPTCIIFHGEIIVFCYFNPLF